MSENMREILIDLRRVLDEIKDIEQQRARARKVFDSRLVEGLEADLKKMEGRRNALVALARLRNVSLEEIRSVLYG